MNKTIITTLVMLIAIAVNAAAIGVTPALTTMNYEPGKNYTIEFSIANTRDETIKVAMIPSGEIDLKLKESVIELKPLETRKQEYKFTMPSNLESGTRTSGVMIQEVLDETQGIQVATAVQTRLNVKVPYNGKEVETEVGMEPEEKKVDFTIAVTNLGTETIKNLNAEIRIQDDTIKTESKELTPQKRTEFRTNWLAPANGKYLAEITINYDDKSRKITKEFNAGSDEAVYFKIEPEQETTQEEKDRTPTLIISLAVLLTLNIAAYIIIRIRKRRKRF